MPDQGWWGEEGATHAAPVQLRGPEGPGVGEESMPPYSHATPPSHVSPQHNGTLHAFHSPSDHTSKTKQNEKTSTCTAQIRLQELCTSLSPSNATSQPD